MNRRLRWALCASFAFVVATARADEIGDALDASVAAAHASRESQARVNKLDDEAKALIEKRRAAQWKGLQLATYADQLEKEAKAEEDKRAGVKAQLDHIATTGTDLMPLMKRMVAELDTFVAGDLPFLAQPRRQRVEELKQLLDDPQRGVAEKFRRVMEAYRTEVDYGHSLGAEDADGVDCGGARGKAALVRVGRVGLYCLAEDRKHAAYWDAKARSWQTLDDADEVKKALAIARGEAQPELLELPVRPAEPVK